MRIILTHEQADFDAIASLLGAYLLDQVTIPVLPRRINRNVKAFLTIYGSELPFQLQEDLPNEPIERVYLVDTQSLVSVKGWQDTTQIYVFDHHSPRKNIPPDWHVHIENTGATTTIFVEALQERSIIINPIQATLLLLGIYEDTGTLTYSRTTSRDIRAAAYLLECGANLTTVSNYINHPLTQKQQKIYDQARKNTSTVNIHGHNIIITSADARGTDEELSTIAHKLRDFYDPDALFFIVEIDGGIQLISRSSSEAIDVAKILDHFGGGGHPRAAAALIKDQEIKEIKSKLTKVLNENVEPSLVVADIMSTQPIVLKPSASVSEIAELMQRYGYEGFPVEKDGKIIGLVTRRAVDKAITHKLNLPAEKLMDAGEFTIQPTASIEVLQNLMIQSGWGQIPVVDNNGKVIGIVTRTDLLKTYATPSKSNTHLKYSESLKKALPLLQLKLLILLADIAFEQRNALYIVGGFVRDLILNVPSTDYDLVVEGDAIALAKQCQRRYGGRIVSHKRFGTAKWDISHIKSKIGHILLVYQPLYTILTLHVTDEDNKDESDFSSLPDTIDLITARREFYTHPTALPTIEQGSIKLDLHRRDFTINTLALRLDGNYFGQLYDYWGGLDDLKQKKIRVLHSLSFIDDPTRILRAIRYEQRYEFTIEERTMQLLLDAIPLLGRVSGDRIRHEINHIFLEPNAPQMLKRLSNTGILRGISPNLIIDDAFLNRIHNYDEENLPGLFKLPDIWKSINTRVFVFYLLWLIDIPYEHISSVCERLKLQKVIRESSIITKDIYSKYAHLNKIKPSNITRDLAKAPLPAIGALYLTFDNPVIKKHILEYASKWRDFKPFTTGQDLKKHNIPQGPVYKQILQEIKDAWIDGKIKSREDELLYLNQLIKKYTSDQNNVPED